MVILEKTKAVYKGRNVVILTKKCFDAVYINSNESRQSVHTKYGISSRLFNHSYWTHYTKEERKILGGQKISASQKKKNSNSINTGKPRKLLPKDILIKLVLEDGRSLEWISRYFQCAPQTVSRNIDFYNIGISGKHKTNGFLTPTMRIQITKLDEVFGTDLLSKYCLNNIARRDVQGIEDDLNILSTNWYDIKLILNKVRINNRGYAKSNKLELKKKYNAVTTINYLFYKAFFSFGYDTEHEFKLNDKFFDLRIKGTNILIEIDSKHYHNSEDSVKNDKIKNKIAIQNGFNLIRINTNKDNYPVVLKKVDICLKELKSSQLLQ